MPPRVGTRVVVSVSSSATTEAQGGRNAASGTFRCGTVRFVGETQFRAGQWVGVELDGPDGRHSGEIDGVRYFTCSANHGLFVRPNAVEPMSSAAGKIPAAQAPPPPLAAASSRSNDGREADEHLFSISARTFVFDKPNKKWIEVATGNTGFYWNRGAAKFLIRQGQSIEHLIALKTKLEASVTAQQSWVFRSTRRREMKNEILCLQFNSVRDASNFVVTFERFRARFIDESATVASATSTQRSTDTGGARRRLTISGNNPMLEGYQTAPSPETLNRKHSSERIASRSNSQGAIVDNSIIESYAGVSRKGFAPYNPDKQNQDSMIMEPIAVSSWAKVNGKLEHNTRVKDMLFAVFDGHGEVGHTVSRRFRDNLGDALSRSSKFSSDQTTNEAISNSLIHIENGLISDPRVDTSLSGTTAVVSLLRGNKLFVNNAGDSRIVKGVKVNGSRRVLRAVDLSQDHKPDDPKEKQRINAVGGRVFAMTYDDGIPGPARVWLAHADLPGLAMSRSMCDCVGKEAGVTSDPECFVYELGPEDDCLVLASDGLWEFMTSQEVIDIVAACRKISKNPRDAILKLVEESTRRWKREEPVIDDTTVVLVYLK